MLTAEKINELLVTHHPRMKGVLCDHWMKKHHFPNYIVLATADSPFISSVEFINATSNISQKIGREADGSYLIPCDQLPPFLSPTIIQQAEGTKASGKIPIIIAGRSQVCVAVIESTFTDDFYRKTLPEVVAMSVSQHRQKGHRTDVVVIFHPDAVGDEDKQGDEMIIVPLMSSEVENDMFSQASGHSIEEIRATIADVPNDQVAVILIFPDYMLVVKCPRPIDPSLN